MKRRDPEAMGVLYDRYGKAAYSLILRIVHEQQAAEDVLAETFVKAWNQIERLAHESKDRQNPDLGLWVLLLARNHAFESLRPAGNWLGGAPQTLPELERPALFQQSARDRNTRLRTLRGAFLRLGTKERQALEAACFEGLAVNEIAVKLEEPPVEVKQLIASALAKLAAAVTVS
ncbi:MAG TPA: sigma-70 family RNA polymerase sigma factor [Bryobacteraceae bacterium]|jgi:RNA polymerase sigma-70 factor (ECF subfamily)